MRLTISLPLSFDIYQMLGIAAVVQREQIAYESLVRIRSIRDESREEKEETRISKNLPIHAYKRYMNVYIYIYLYKTSKYR